MLPKPPPTPARRATALSLRPFMALGIATLLIFAVAAIVGAHILSGSFATIEQDTAEQRAHQQLHAFEADLSQLEISARDYAEWDDAWHYVHDGDAGFIASNLTPDTLGGMHVSAVVIVDDAGKVLYSSTFNEGGREIVSPAPTDLLTMLVPMAQHSDTLARLPPSRRVLLTERGPMAFTTSRITRTDKSEPTAFHMLFGRYVDNTMMERVRRTSELPVRWINLRDSGSGLPEAIRAWSISDGATTRVETAGEERIASYVLVRDSGDAPLAVLASESARTITRFGSSLTHSLLGGFVLLLLAFYGAVTWLLVRLHRVHQSSAGAEARYRKVADQLNETIVLVDAVTLEIVDINSAAMESLGYLGKEVSALKVMDIFPDLTRELLHRDPAHGRRICQSRLRCKDGTEQDTEVSVSDFRDDHRRLLCLVGHDVSHRRAAEEQHRANQRKLLHMAQHDPLTGLPNRLYLRSKFPRVIRHAQDAQRGIALIYVDVDHFKNINDSLGHGHGDRLLQIVAQRLRNTVGAQDAVVRMGGDEFVIVATLVPEAASIDNLAQRIQASICAPIVVDETPFAVTASMGIAVYPRDGLDLDLLLKHSDIALYQAKEAGRHCHRFFDAAMDLRVSEDVALEQALRHALGTNQFYLEFQPVVDLRSNRVASMEALLRWNHPEMGQVPPSRFVPIAERTGLITQLGQFALENALHQMRAWLDVGVACVPVAINVAPQQLARNDFAALVRTLTQQVGIEPRWLRFEITESALLQNVQQLVGTLSELRELGSQILIDDFGTGYSGLSYLTKLPVDTVKIDRSFVMSLKKDTKDEAVIGSIIDMAAKLNLVTVAEGVETREQALMLRRLGCTFAQGYFFSRPLSARRCRRLLQKMHAMSASVAGTRTVAEQLGDLEQTASVPQAAAGR